ncbi:hypothetical protein NE236_23870 [Actinoallomurus purpureus]|uniref:hypothetical protein n=1 Tax=Actinoallomurus purpureus TaxID=478114 RepID=UPI002092DEE2|nr:hypothetical protein [Actinoallomurus purpureus]MCO6008021.1 hypothetical protein [Actinoallomurus purpureus]
MGVGDGSVGELCSLVGVAFTDRVGLAGGVRVAELESAAAAVLRRGVAVVGVAALRVGIGDALGSEVAALDEGDVWSPDRVGWAGRLGRALWPAPVS